MKTILSVMIVLLLSACGTPVPIVKNVFVAPPSALLNNCVLIPPVPVETYKAMTHEQREDAQVDIYIRQTGAISDCNTDKTKLRKWVEDQKKIYQTDKPAEVKRNGSD